MMNENILDAINLASFIAQMDNLTKDEIQNNYMQQVIQAISKEINKLHKENDRIIKQNEEIIKILKERDCD